MCELKFVIRDEEDLLVTLEDMRDLDLLRELVEENGNDVDLLRELSESYWTNGWFVGGADELGNLSEAPMISNDFSYDDDGNPFLLGDTWYYPYYQTRNFFDDIIENGYALFAVLG